MAYTRACQGFFAEGVKPLSPPNSLIPWVSWQVLFFFVLIHQRMRPTLRGRTSGVSREGPAIFDTNRSHEFHRAGGEIEEIGSAVTPENQ